MTLIEDIFLIVLTWLPCASPDLSIGGAESDEYLLVDANKGSRPKRTFHFFKQSRQIRPDGLYRLCLFYNRHNSVLERS